MPCALTWDAGSPGKLTVTASAVLGNNPFSQSKEITSRVDDDGITVTLPHEIPGLTVIAALYNRNNQMTDCFLPEISANTLSMVNPGDGLRLFFIAGNHCPISPSLAF